MRLDSDETAGGPLVIDSYGGKSLPAQSHGKSFLALFLPRFQGRGLCIFDEPEAALSPMRQLVETSSQFLIATRSPMLLAYPGALIYRMSEAGIERVAYETTDRYQVSRGFLDNPRGILNELFSRLD